MTTTTPKKNNHDLQGTRGYKQNLGQTKAAKRARADELNDNARGDVLQPTGEQGVRGGDSIPRQDVLQGSSRGTGKIRLHRAVSLPVGDPVASPPHYTAGKVECIDAIESAIEGLHGLAAFCAGNVLKYVWRHRRKGGAQDLRKARWYLDKLTTWTEHGRDGQ